MTDLTTLQALAAYTLDRIHQLDAVFFDYYDLNRSYGLRWNELVTRERWTNISGTRYLVTTSKGSNTRIVDIDPKHIIVLNNLNGVEQYSSNRYMQAWRTWNKAIYPYFVRYNNKDCSTHLFRYLVIRELKAQGQTDAQIKIFTGIRTNAILQGYLNNSLTTNFII